MSAERLPAKQRVLLIFKSLTYDKQIKKGRDALRVGVVYRAGDGDSKAVGREVLQQMRGVQHLRVSDLEIKALAVTAKGDPVSFVARIEKSQANVLYLAPGIDEFLPPLCALAASKKLLVISGERAHAKICAALTVVKQGTRAKVLLNLKAASSQGASFDERLLRVAELVP